MNIYYVYQYLREDGTPYYIGKGKGNRAYAKHIRHGVDLTPSNRNQIEILVEDLNEKDALELEIELIRYYGRLDLENGILENRSFGGEGDSELIKKQLALEKKLLKESWKRYCNLSPEEWIKEAEEFWSNK